MHCSIAKIRSVTLMLLLAVVIQVHRMTCLLLLVPPLLFSSTVGVHEEKLLENGQMYYYSLISAYSHWIHYAEVVFYNVGIKERRSIYYWYWKDLSRERSQ